MHSETFLLEAEEICGDIDPRQIETMAANLSLIEGRVYLVGLGGSLANCQHIAADLRKLCHIDAVAPDNLAELTAWANDESWEALFHGFLINMTAKDALFVLSVGGGHQGVSAPITASIGHAIQRGAKIFGIVGPHGGTTAISGHHVVKIPVKNQAHVTPHTEAFQAVLWHCLVSHPLLQKQKTKW